LKWSLNQKSSGYADRLRLVGSFPAWWVRFLDVTSYFSACDEVWFRVAPYASKKSI